MGITGLLPLLKPIQRHERLSSFEGQTLAVDAYVWLHRGAYGCAVDIVTGKNTKKYVEYAMQRVRYLKHLNITPYIVFDGGHLPAKLGTEDSRKRKREENLRKAKQLSAQGKHSQAREFYIKCLDVTPQMAYQLIKALRAEHVPYVVAPYEADAQMAYLERTGVVSGIITEDSDLLVFGCKQVLFKLDITNESCVVIRQSDFGRIMGEDGGVSFVGWSETDFRRMAILSGCDYLPSINGIGLKTAWKLLRKYKTIDKVLQSIRLEGKKVIPPGYQDTFQLAELTFLHQRVYDAQLQRTVCLQDIPTDRPWDKQREEYIGLELDPILASGIADGSIDPLSRDAMIDIDPECQPTTLDPRALKTKDANRPERRQPASAIKKEGSRITNYFSATPVTSPRRQKSGKRTLAEVQDQEIVVAKRGRQSLPTASSSFEVLTKQNARSKSTGLPSYSPTTSQETVPSQAKSSIYFPSDEDIAVGTVVDVDVEFDIESVSQEEGYLSIDEDIHRTSSPSIPSPSREYQRHFVDVDPVSSPPTKLASTWRSASPREMSALEDISWGPDLRNIFDKETPPVSSSLHPDPQSGQDDEEDEDIEPDDEDEVTSEELRSRANIRVFAGWISTYSHQHPKTKNKDKILTPIQRQLPTRFPPSSVNHCRAKESTTTTVLPRPIFVDDIGPSSNDLPPDQIVEKVVSNVRTKLGVFRFCG